MSNPENAAIYIESKNKSISSIGLDKLHLPAGISTGSLDNLFSHYVESANCAYGYLEIIANMHEVSDKTKLRARRKAKEMAATIFSKSNGFTFGVEIRYVEQDQVLKLAFENGIAKYSYDIDWITKEVDSPTILNNFIYLFEFVDRSGRVSLVTKESEVAVMERILKTERTDWYPTGLVFGQKNQAAMMQLYSYSRVLESVGIRIESVLEWFFSDYLKENHGISNFHMALPSASTSYPEKCRILAPEIERVIRQYVLYCQDGFIDQELLSIGSQPSLVAECPSVVQNKYVYRRSADVQRAIYYFFSDQCMLLYDSSTQESTQDF